MKRYRTIFVGGVALLVSAALLLLVASYALAQDDVDQLPPHVIDVYPYPGEEVSLDQPVELTFDQPVDAASVESAWQMEPSAPGTFSWPDDDTLTFIPEGGWTRATRYQITIGTGAMAANGLPLEEAYEFFVQTVGYLQVSAVIPAADAEGVAADATITVSFDRPVVPLVTTEEQQNLPRPVTFTPDIDGAGEWVNTSIYVFTPRDPLKGGTTYTVTVPAGLTDVTGSVLEQDYVWSFKTLPPEILNVYPYQNQAGLVLETTIEIDFSQPMNTASTEEAFLLQFNGERVPGKFEWSNNDQHLTFKPDERLKIESVYLINVAPTARSATGEATLSRGISYSFSTVPYPGIARTEPQNGEQGVSPGYGVWFEFTSPMNPDTFEGKAEIIQPEGVKWEPVVQGNQSFFMNFATQPETQYVIRFKAGAEDVYGNSIQSDYTLTFTTGTIQPWASLAADGRFMITNAYRENTRIAVAVSGKPTVGFALYKVDETKLGLVSRGYLYDEDVAQVINAANLVRLWDEQLDPGTEISSVDEVWLASEEGGQLPTGVYFLQARVPNSDRPQQLSLGVVNANLTVKRTPDEVLVWMTDIESAEPIPGATVELHRYDGSLLTSGQTDPDGIFRSVVELGTDESVFAIARGDGTYGVWFSWYESDLPDVNGYVYTDRPIYRPGETVYFRGVIRDRNDMTYTLPHAETVHVTVDLNWGAQILLDTDVVLSEFGTFDGEFDLPDDVQLGQASIAVSYKYSYDASVYFTIAEFRVPEYKVEVTPDNSEIIQGDPLKAVVAASYYFGGPVSSASMYWTAYGQMAYFNYTGPGRYDFVDEWQSYFDWVNVGSGEATTDANGQVILSFDSVQSPSVRPMTVAIEGEVTDESGQYIAGRSSVLVHPANVYVGLRTNRYFGRENEPVNVDLIAVTPGSEPLAGQKIELKVVEIRWERVAVEDQYGRYEWNQTEVEVETGEVVTGDDGTAQYSFTPPQAGIYRVVALSRDERERVNYSSLQFWVTGTRPVWWGRPSDRIELIADKDLYQPGDTAEVLVPIPFTGVSYVLMTVERAGIQQAEVMRVEGSTLVYKLPITDQHIPTIHVTATLMKGMDEENLNPAYRLGSLALQVEPVNQRITVTITPSTPLAQPGETVTFDVKTTDSRGEPVSAEVGIHLTDQAILSLMPPNSSTLEATYYGPQGNYVDTGVALSVLLDVMTDELIKERERRDALNAAAPTPTAAPMATSEGMVMEEAADADGAGAPQEAQQVEVREDFQQTPLWAPRVVTDQTGQATVSVTLPDNLTTWHLDARGITVDTEVGQTELNVISTLPLLTRPVTPRFFVVGDRVTLASVINNNTNAPQQVNASLEGSGFTFESDAAQTVAIEAGQRARVEWVVVIEDVPYVDLTFYAIGENGYSDAAKPMLATGPDGTIPVYRYTAPDTVGTGGILREEGGRTEAISLPPRLDVDQGELTIKVDPSLAVTTIDALDYLSNFPHQCIEQTISRFLPNVMTYRALKSLGVDDPELEQSLRTVLDYALKRLANEQNPDGGWGWFSGMESNPYITAYAVLGLVEARDAGFDIDAGMIDRGAAFARAYLIRPTIDTHPWELNRQAFFLYVFARAGQVYQAELDALLAQRLEMDYWALSFLLMAYHQADPASAAIPQLVSDLQTGAILSATGAHWEEKEIDWWHWSSDTRTTAMALAALTRVQPELDLLPNIVRWLMVARQGDHWVTTQETAWAVMALTDWMVASGELKGNYDYAVTLNRATLTEDTVTPETIREGAVLHVAVKDLLLDEANRLTFIRGEGDGVLYYTAHLKLRLWASEARPVSRGITVTREYTIEGNPETPVNQAKMGDVINVRVTMNLNQDIYYFVLEDPIPSGTEPINTSLLTTSGTNEPPRLRSPYNPYWWWGWWWFDHTEMRDEQINLYADFLPRGTYVYTYQIRATIPGEFQTMPSHAYAFYFPEVFGRGAGTLFTVNPAEE